MVMWRPPRDLQALAVDPIVRAPDVMEAHAVDQDVAVLGAGRPRGELRVLVGQRADRTAEHPDVGGRSQPNAAAVLEVSEGYVVGARAGLPASGSHAPESEVVRPVEPQKAHLDRRRPLRSKYHVAPRGLGPVRPEGLIAVAPARQQNAIPRPSQAIGPVEGAAGTHSRTGTIVSAAGCQIEAPAAEARTIAVASAPTSDDAQGQPGQEHAKHQCTDTRDRAPAC